MSHTRFGWAEALAGNRFHAPVSEGAILEAGAVAGLREGMTVLEVACGNGAVLVLLAEEWHIYARGIDASAPMVESARHLADRSSAGGRVRFFHEDPTHPEAGHGPVESLWALRGHPAGVLDLLQPGGRLVTGRFVAKGAADPEVAEVFPLAAEPPGRLLWQREATPLEWERYFAPQERALRAYRRGLREGETVSPLALALDRQINVFRSHAGSIAYELSVLRAPE